MVYVAKMVPYSNGASYAFGRVFSGKITLGQKALVIGPYHQRTPVQCLKKSCHCLFTVSSVIIIQDTEDIAEINIGQVCVDIGRVAEEIGDCPCGNLVLLRNLEKHIVGSGGTLF